MEKSTAISEEVKKKLIITLISLLGIGYSVLLAYLDYTAFFCDIVYTNRVKFALVGAVIAVAVCFLDFFTRTSRFTAFLGMINMVLYFPMLMVDWGNWPLLIPFAVVTLFGFFCCHMNETAKTVFGTIFLLLYIIGGIAFFFVSNFFFVRTTDTLLESSPSPSGVFRYYLLNVENKASGKLVVYVQPNTLDKDNGMFVAKTTIRKMIHQENKPAQITCRWEGENLYVNDELYFTESEYAVMGAPEVIYTITNSNWTYTRFNLDYPLSETVSRLYGKIKDYLAEKKAKQQAVETAVAVTGTTSEAVPVLDGEITTAEETEETAAPEIEIPQPEWE